MVFEDYWPDTSIGPARAKVLETFPRGGVSSLHLAEAATYGCADRSNPKLSSVGIELGTTAAKRDLKQRALRLAGRSKAPADGIQANYTTNYSRVVDALRPQLSPETNVFTHNPWGEYGHEDHIQVFRALETLRGEIGFKLWISNYCTERSLPLAMRYFDNRVHDFIRLPVDKDFAAEVVDCYKNAGCWTWADDWVWFDDECFMEAPSQPVDGGQQGHLFPLNLFRIGGA